jgi:hypothetical protein
MSANTSEGGRSQVKDQVERIRSEIDLRGESTVESDDLRMLCLGEAIPSEQFNRVSDIAQQENWSFAFFKDGTVRFAKLEKDS